MGGKKFVGRAEPICLLRKLLLKAIRFFPGKKLFGHGKKDPVFHADVAVQ
jgi:hypothetical protein